MPQWEVLEIIFPCIAEILGSARPRAHPKTLLLLAEASSSAASWSLNPTNSSDLNVFKCLPGYFLCLPCGFLRVLHRSQQVDKKRRCRWGSILPDHFQAALQLSHSYLGPISLPLEEGAIKESLNISRLGERAPSNSSWGPETEQFKGILSPAPSPVADLSAQKVN